MNVTIQLTSEEETRLRAVADARGLRLEEMVHDLIASQLPRTPAADPTPPLMEAWDQEDATEDTQEIAIREREWREFQQSASTGLSLRSPKR